MIFYDILHIIIVFQAELSPYKFDHGANIKQPEWVHVVSAKQKEHHRHIVLVENHRSLIII